MPYSNDFAGIYKLTNKATGLCYVGQSQNVKKRIKDHFRLLRWNRHPNKKLQNAYNEYGQENFVFDVEAVCENLKDLDTIENAFLSGDAFFNDPTFYNIADFAKAPMRNKKHSEEAKKRISIGRKMSSFDYQSEEYKEKLKKAQQKRLFSDKKFVAKVKFIIDNPNMTYAERGRVLGSDTGSVRKLALKYDHLKGVL